MELAIIVDVKDLKEFDIQSSGLFPCPHNDKIECRITENCYECSDQKLKVNLNGNTVFYDKINPLAEKADSTWNN